MEKEVRELEHFQLPSSDQLHGGAGLLLQQDQENLLSASW